MRRRATAKRQLPVSDDRQLSFCLLLYVNSRPRLALLSGIAG
jgi:hypothetical protein